MKNDPRICVRVGVEKKNYYCMIAEQQGYAHLSDFVKDALEEKASMQKDKKVSVPADAMMEASTKRELDQIRDNSRMAVEQNTLILGVLLHNLLMATKGNVPVLNHDLFTELGEKFADGTLRISFNQKGNLVIE